MRAQPILEAREQKSEKNDLQVSENEVGTKNCFREKMTENFLKRARGGGNTPPHFRQHPDDCFKH